MRNIAHIAFVHRNNHCVLTNASLTAAVILAYKEVRTVVNLRHSREPMLTPDSLIVGFAHEKSVY